MAFSAYSVAVKLSLVQNVTYGLAAISTALAKTGRDVDNLHGKLKAIKALTLGGAALGGVGMFGLGMLKTTLPEGAQYLHQLQQMKQAGMSVLEVEKARAAAIKNLRAAPTSSTMENLATIRELRAVFGETDEAIMALPTMAKMQAILSTVKGVTNAKGTAFEVAKLLDIRGKTNNSAEFARESDMITKAIVASGGTVTPSDFFGTGKYGRAATAGWSAEFMYEILPTLIQEMKSQGGAGGAGGPGNALMTAYATVIQGKIAKKNLPNWTGLGLLDPDKIVKSKSGIGQGVEMGGVVGWRDFQANPFLWMQSYVMPKLRQRYGKDDAQIKAYIERMFGSRTEAFVMTQMALQPWKFTRDQKIIRKAMGLEGYAQMVRENPYAAKQAYEAQVASLQGELAITILPLLVTGLTKVTGALTTLTEWAHAHPRTVKVLVGALAALSIMSTIAGFALLLRGAFIGLGIVMQMLGLGGALGGGVARLLPLLATLGPWVLRLSLLFLRFLPIVGWVVTAVTLLVAFWPQISDFFGKVKTKLAELLGLKTGPLTTEATNYLGGNVPGEPGKPRKPYVPTAADMNRFAYGNGNVYVDGRKVGEIVSGHQARATGQTRVGAARHDPRATPAAAGAGVSR